MNEWKDSGNLKIHTFLVHFITMEKWKANKALFSRLHQSFVHSHTLTHSKGDHFRCFQLI